MTNTMFRCTLKVMFTHQKKTQNKLVAVDDVRANVLISPCTRETKFYLIPAILLMVEPFFAESQGTKNTST